MYNKVPFFSEAETLLANHKASPVERTQKYLDAEYAYKKLLVEKLLDKSIAQNELMEIFFSQWIDICAMPLKLHKKFQEEKFIQDLKEMGKKRILDELKDCQRLINSAKQDDVDYIYLNIFFQCRMEQIEVDSSLTKKNVKKILAYLYQERDVKKPFKKMMKSIHSRDKNAPAMAGIHFKEKILAILEPEISAECVQFLHDMKVDIVENTYAIVVDSEADKRIYGLREIKPLEQCLPNMEAQNLINAFKLAVQALDQGLIVHGQGSINTRYILYFDLMKKLYAVERQIHAFLAEFKKQEQEAQDKIAATVSTSIVSDKVGIRAVEVSLHIDSIPEVEASLPIETAALSKEKGCLPLAEETMPVGAAAPKLQSMENVPTEIPDGKEKDEEAEEKKEEKEEDVEQVYTTFFQSFASKDKKRKQPISLQPQSNVLDLKKEHLDTYLKVFGLKTYDSINLRALVNLTTQVFGGVIKKSGANRCRIKMKNIYAFILAPQEALENVAKTATVTMHGGGHRSVASQNNDREKAPDYLIHQFRSAFERAGFTPVHLGLEHYQETGSPLRLP